MVGECCCEFQGVALTIFLKVVCVLFFCKGETSRILKFKHTTFDISRLVFFFNHYIKSHPGFQQIRLIPFHCELAHNGVREMFALNPQATKLLVKKDCEARSATAENAVLRDQLVQTTRTGKVMIR